MRFYIILTFLSCIIFWWLHERQNVPLIDVINCALKRGIYNFKYKKCDIIRYNLTAMYNKAKYFNEVFAINTTSKKKRKRKGEF